MNELISAGAFRLKRDRVFWACFVVMLVLSAAATAISARQCRLLAAEGYAMSLGSTCFQLLPAAEMCIAVFTGLYIGTDHSEGGLRNRLVVGHSREQLYLAQLSVTAMAALAFTTAWLVGSGAVIFLNREFWRLGAGQALCYLCIATGSSLALASILTMLGMLTEKKSTAAVTAILLVVGLLLAMNWLYSRLQEPEMESGLIITASGMEWGTPTPNPRYVSGTVRQVFTLLLNMLPAGQAVLLADMAVTHPVGDLAASGAVALVSTLAGMALFRKKDLK